MAADKKEPRKTAAKNSEKENKNGENPAKDSEPNTSKCGKCEVKLLEKPKLDSEQSIECDCCLQFYHIFCVDVSVDKMIAVSTHKLKWYCPTCEPASAALKRQCVTLQAEQTKIRGEINEINRKLSSQKTKVNKIESDLNAKINEKFDNLQSQIDNLSSKVEEKPDENTPETDIQNLQTQISELQTKYAEALKKNLPEETTSIKSIVAAELKEKLKNKVDEEDLKEANLRDKKKLNLIFFDFKEEEHESTEDLMKDDFNKIKSVYEERVPLNEKDITHITRIGKKTAGKTRPILVSFKNEEIKMQILRNGRNLTLKTDDWESCNVYVAMDKTPKQRETEKRLRAEIKERTAKGESNLVIRNEKIVPFRPAAQKWASLFE